MERPISGDLKCSADARRARRQAPRRASAFSPPQPHKLDGVCHDRKKIINVNGAPVPDNFNIQTAGPCGPALLQDVWLIEKLAHFDREVIPERRMHAKGAGAHGTFSVAHDVTRYTKASIFAGVARRPSQANMAPPMLSAISVVSPSNLHGPGNWDLVLCVRAGS
jgi:hypothetical protein